MTENKTVLKNDEKAIFSLRGLYEKYGYSQYKMSKFEEYDLYVRNKDFLVSDNIITFTDTNGKLMALKPDVTLSIIKNSDDSTEFLSKMYYNENVYRVSKGSHAFKEIMQTGLECIGLIDDYCIYEVLMLACESLAKISKDYVLDISDLEILSAVIDASGVSDASKAKLLNCIGEKNFGEIAEICQSENADLSDLKILATTYGKPAEVIATLKTLKCEKAADSIARLEKITSALEKNGYGDNIRIDFSVINDMNYYNGYVFKGFINGIASGVLSGGSYDRLMRKMGKKSNAIGFAVYLDLLQRLAENERTYDVDTVLVYDENADINALNDAINLLTSGGKSVMAQKCVPEKIKYKQLLKLNERGVEIIENNA